MLRSQRWIARMAGNCMPRIRCVMAVRLMMHERLKFFARMHLLLSTSLHAGVQTFIEKKMGKSHNVFLVQQLIGAHVLLVIRRAEQFFMFLSIRSSSEKFHSTAASISSRFFTTRKIPSTAQ